MAIQNSNVDSVSTALLSFKLAGIRDLSCDFGVQQTVYHKPKRRAPYIGDVGHAIRFSTKSASSWHC